MSLTARPGSACSARRPRSARCMCISPAESRRRGATLSISPATPRKAGSTPTSSPQGIGVSEKLTGELVDAGLDHAQLSFQGADKETNDRLGHYKGSWERKRAFAGYVIKAGLPLTINAVIHRSNIHQVRRVHRSCGRAWRAPARSGAYAILRLGARQSRRADAAESPSRRIDRDRARRRATASRANWSSTWWSPTITRAIPNLAPAAGGGSRSMCRRPARRCLATPPS